jgi:hypothetical protein
LGCFLAAVSLEIAEQSQHNYGAATAHLTESGVDAAQGQHVSSTATEHLAESGAVAALTQSVCSAASHNFVIYLYVYCDILVALFNEGSNNAGID